MSNTDETIPSPYEVAARNQKAGLLAGFMAAGYASQGHLTQAPAAVTNLSLERWNEAARLLGINPPSTETVDAAKVYLSQIVAAVNEAKKQ